MSAGRTTPTVASQCFGDAGLPFRHNWQLIGGAVIGIVALIVGAVFSLIYFPGRLICRSATATFGAFTKRWWRGSG